MAFKKLTEVRWWKFDFHVRTPIVGDTPKQQHPLIARQWLTKFMEAETDCIVVSDHPSCYGIDLLRQTYNRMKNEAKAELFANGFRPLTIFPCVEILVQDSVQILGIFDPEVTRLRLAEVLESVRSPMKASRTSVVTQNSIPEVLEIIYDAGGIAVPFDINGADEKICTGKNFQSLWSYAVELIADKAEYPKLCRQRLLELAKTPKVEGVFSQESAGDAKDSVWVKMETPNLEGLRSAVWKSNSDCVVRCSEVMPTNFDPLQVPEHFISSIEINGARFLGREKSAVFPLSPCLNVVVGGQETGKSAVIHALRVAMQRSAELESLGNDCQAELDFNRFCRIYTTSRCNGGLLRQTRVTVNWKHNGDPWRVKWKAAKRDCSLIEEENAGVWQPTENQSLSYIRFPLKIYSQGQIAELAVSGRKLLLQQIDRAAGIDTIRQDLIDTADQIQTLGEKNRELVAKMDQIPEIQRQIIEKQKKLMLFSLNSKGDQLEKDYNRAVRQTREIHHYVEQLRSAVCELRACCDKVVPDDWSPTIFDSSNVVDSGVLQWRKSLDQSIQSLMQQIMTEADHLQRVANTVKQDPRLKTWSETAAQIGEDYRDVKKRLEKDALCSENFTWLRQEVWRLQSKEKTLMWLQQEQTDLSEEYKDAYLKMCQLHRKLTSVRQAFIDKYLRHNDYIQIKVVPLGFDVDRLKTELQNLLETKKGVFDEDLLKIDGVGNEPRGLLKRWMTADREDQDSMNAKLTYLGELKHYILEPEEAVDLQDQFRSKLKTLLQRPEFQDRVMTWFPEDDLEISLRRGSKWIPAAQGTKGERSAALLAFLFSFGNEPLVLDQPEDDLDNRLIYDLLVKKIRENKLRRQLLIVTRNADIVLGGEAEMVYVMENREGQCCVKQRGSLQDEGICEEICKVMNGGSEAFRRCGERLKKDG